MNTTHRTAAMIGAALIASGANSSDTWLGSARASEFCNPADGISTCVASDNLWTHPGGGAWFSQAPTNTAPRGSISFGVVPTVYLRPIGLRLASADPDGTTIYAVDNVVASTFMVGIGVTERLQVQISSPITMYQDGSAKADVVGGGPALSRSAAGDLRFGASFAALPRPGDQEGAGLTLRFEMTAPTGNDAAFAGYNTSAYAPGAAFDYRIGPVTMGADIGVRIRDHVKIAGAVIGTQISGSLGVSYDILDNGYLSASLEAFALFGVLEQSELVSEPGQFIADEQASGVPHIPAEWMLSVRTAGLLDGKFRASLGGGSFIPTVIDGLPITTPAARFALGLHYVYSLGGDAAASAPATPMTKTVNAGQ